MASARSLSPPYLTSSCACAGLLTRVSVLCVPSCSFPPEWDEVVKLLRTLSREVGFPIGAESNLLMKLFEAYADDNAPFPPKQMILSRQMLDPEQGHWMRIMSLVLVSKPVATYSAIFASKRYSGMKALCIWGCDVGDVGVKHLAEIALPLLPHCCKLELMDVGMGVKGCESLALQLKQRRSTHLKILRMDHNPAIGSEGVARLAEGLYFNSLLHTLSLSYCGLTAGAGVFLSNILQTRDIGLCSLSLEGNNLAREGVMSLSQGLLGNKTLTSLNLANNNFGGDGDPGSEPRESDAIRYLTAGIGGCKALKNVNLGGNLIGRVGFQSMLAAIDAKELTHVTELEVTPFVPDCELYKQLVDKIEAQKPPKTKKKKKRATKKK